jgi:ubiquinone/menaquinone biosynthesis C-methylase UbiE
MSDKAKFRPTERFSGLADIYAKARPSYPDAAIDFILAHCKLTKGLTLADIGCGTGISTRLFSTRGLNVIGVEPNDDMRRQAQSAEPSSDSATVEYRNGTGEHSQLENNSVDAAIAAQAFHWFEPEEALAEFHRILKPHGWAILMWNERDESDPFTTEYGDIIRAQKGTEAVESQRGSRAGQPLLNSKLFTDASLSKFANEQVVSEEGLIMRACSASYAPTEEEPLQLMKEQLSKVFRKFSQNDLVSIKYETLVFTGQRINC